MVGLNNRTQVSRNRLLYDPTTLERIADEHGHSPSEIKMGVRTRATQYEIRTALRYWLGGGRSHRTSDRIWDNCRAVDDGQYELDKHDNLVGGGDN